MIGWRRCSGISNQHSCESWNLLSVFLWLSILKIISWYKNSCDNLNLKYQGQPKPGPPRGQGLVGGDQISRVSISWDRPNKVRRSWTWGWLYTPRPLWKWKHFDTQTTSQFQGELLHFSSGGLYLVWGRWSPWACDWLALYDATPSTLRDSWQSDCWSVVLSSYMSSVQARR